MSKIKKFKITKYKKEIKPILIHKNVPFQVVKMLPEVPIGQM